MDCVICKIDKNSTSIDFFNARQRSKPSRTSKRFSCSCSLPLPDVAWNDAEQRMRLRRFNRPETAINLRGACSEFRLQVRPLVKQLSSRFLYVTFQLGGADFGSVEMIAASLRLLRKAG
jgi:hypothetical protein